jgi:hypothetical protein
MAAEHVMPTEEEDLPSARQRNYRRQRRTSYLRSSSGPVPGEIGRGCGTTWNHLRVRSSFSPADTVPAV